MNEDGMRNPIIEFWRFVACIAIALFHFEWVYMGHPVYLKHFYIWVEFFFILSGFFVALNTIGSNKELTTLVFLKKELKKIYPMYLVAFIFSFSITNLVNEIQVKEWILLLWQSKWEVLLLQMTGFVTSGVSYNVASGYVSALLISTFIIHFLLKNNYKIFVNIIAPLFIMCGYARLIHVYSNISQWLAFDTIICSGVIRALAGMSLGVLSYIIMVPFFRKMQRQRILIFKILIAIALFCLVKYRLYITKEDLVFYIFLFALLITTSYCQKNIYFDKINKLMIYLGKLSYPIFLFHFGTLLFLKEYYGSWNYNNMMIVFLIIIIIEGIVLSNFKKLFDYRKL